MTVLILGLILFFGTHSIQIAVPGIRERVVARGGRGAWMLPYAGLAGAGLVLLVIGYGMARHEAPLLYRPPIGLRHLALTLMLPVFPLLLATYIRGRIGQMLGHPMLIATILWATAHLLANGSLANLLLFGGFLVWAALDWRSLLSRQRAAPPQERKGWGRNDAVAIVGGLALYAAFIGGLHALLFGVSPI